MRNKIVVVMQPTFFPWLGYFDLIDQADVFIFYNDVQYERRSWQNRNRINCAHGEMFITLPVKKGNLKDSINSKIILLDDIWKKKFFKTLKSSYSKSPYFEEVIEWLENMLLMNFIFLDEFNITLIKSICQKIGIHDTTFVLSSDFQLKSNQRTEKLVELTEINNGNIYLSTIGSKDYLLSDGADKKFQQKGIQLLFHNYSPIVYNTLYKPFRPYMSILDCLFNCGFSECLSVIRAGRRESLSPENLVSK